MGTTLQDLRLALRSFLRKPGFFAVALATLALGIGATTAIFSVVSAVLLEPLPYRDADRLFYTRGSFADLMDLRESEAISGLALSASNMYDIAHDGAELHARGDIVTANFFEVLGVEPALGRMFTAAEDVAGLRLVVLSHGLWQTLFAGDRAAIGKTLTLYGEPHTVVGVMPPHIDLPSEDTRLWTTMKVAERLTSAQGQNRSFRIFRAFGRLAPGVTLARAQEQGDVVAAALARAYPRSNSEFRFAYQPLREAILGEVRPALWILLAMVGLVLLIACANVANLVLTRVMGRGRELAVRMALGAGRGRIVRTLMTESMLLSLLGGAAGVLLAVWGVDVLRALAPDSLPRAGEIDVDGRVLLFAAATSILTGLLFGLAPALTRTRAPLTAMMRDGQPGGDPRRGARLRRGLVVAEVALSVVLVAGAALLGRSFVTLIHTRTGVTHDGVLTAALTLPRGLKPELMESRVARAARFEQIVARLREVPGVIAAGAGNAVPPVSLQRSTQYRRPGDDGPPRDAGWVPVTSGFVEAAGARLVAGRTIDGRDRAGGEPVVVVSLSLAKKVFGSAEAALGGSLQLVNQSERTGESDAGRRIVGVVDDVKYRGLDSDTIDMIYTPMSQTPMAWAYLLVRTQGRPEAMIAAVKAAVAEVAPEQPASNPRSLAGIVAESVEQPRFNLLLFGLFAAIALLLSAIGVYGVVAYGVAQRTRDIGIRMALGAAGGQVVRMVLRQGLWLAAAGIAVGLTAALGLSRLLQGMLFGISPTEPATYAAVAAVLLAITALACWLPARRAARVDPMIAMRAE
jgi:predicted permease